MASLIVPRGYAEGKPNRRPVANPFAGMLRSRKSHKQNRYVGPVWKGVGPQPDEHPGRKYGNTVSSWMSDLTELRKAIVLGDCCQSKFYYQRAHYHRDERWSGRVTGKCDGCRQYVTSGRLYLPEELLINSDGSSSPGQCWAPK